MLKKKKRWLFRKLRFYEANLVRKIFEERNVRYHVKIRFKWISILFIYFIQWIQGYGVIRFFKEIVTHNLPTEKKTPSRVFRTGSRILFVSFSFFLFSFFIIFILLLILLNELSLLN